MLRKATLAASQGDAVLDWDYSDAGQDMKNRVSGLIERQKAPKTWDWYVLGPR
jgi:hypothetical protein